MATAFRTPLIATGAVNGALRLWDPETQAMLHAAPRLGGVKGGVRWPAGGAGGGAADPEQSALLALRGRETRH
mgnify:CR=1 FL=1